jgi:hypothetical protein
MELDDTAEVSNRQRHSKQLKGESEISRAEAGPPRPSPVQSTSVNLNLSSRLTMNPDRHAGQATPAAVACRTSESA